MSKANQKPKTDDPYVVIKLSMIEELGLSYPEVVIYAIINGFSQGEKQECTVSHSYFEKMTKCSRSTVIRKINMLIDMGLVQKVRHVGGRNSYIAIPVSKLDTRFNMTPVSELDTRFNMTPVSKLDTRFNMTPVSELDTRSNVTPVSKLDTRSNMTPVSKLDTCSSVTPVSQLDTRSNMTPVSKLDTSAKNTPVSKLETGTGTTPVSKLDTTPVSEPDTSPVSPVTQHNIISNIKTNYINNKSQNQSSWKSPKKISQDDDLRDLDNTFENDSENHFEDNNPDFERVVDLCNTLSKVEQTDRAKSEIRDALAAGFAVDMICQIMQDAKPSLIHDELLWRVVNKRLARFKERGIYTKAAYLEIRDANAYNKAFYMSNGGGDPHVMGIDESRAYFEEEDYKRECRARETRSGV